MDSLQILIVDDHAPTRRGIRSLLASHAEWQVCGEAVDGLDAVEKVEALHPDVVLMDISMPRLDGLDTARLIRSKAPQCAIVLVSQNDPAIVQQQAAEVKADAFVAKDQLAAKLVSAIQQIAEGRTKTTDAKHTGRHPDDHLGWLAGGEMGDRIRSTDWSKTRLGPLEDWPQSLKTSVSLILNSRHPMWIGWGPDATFLYNDAYIQVLSSAKHPQALGRPAAEVWAEIWDICGPLADKVFQKGEASFLDDVRLFMNRGNLLEETYYSFSYSPIRDESGKVGGLFCPSAEVTSKVINARRLRTLSELSANALTKKTTEAACASSAATLSKNTDDIPFALLYLTDQASKKAYLSNSCGDATGPATISLDAIEFSPVKNEEFSWPVAEVVTTAQARVVQVDKVDGLPAGPAQQRLAQALLLPLTCRGENRPLGVLIAGINPTRLLDAEYRTFYELVAGQIATAIRNARAAEEERERLEALAEIDRAKTAFFSNVSHEFRTPLTLMLGPVEELLARSHTDLSPAAKRQLELVNRNGSRLLRLVNTLLDFSRIEAGRMRAIYLPTDLSVFTIELASVFRSATEKAGLELELDCPKLAEPVYVDRGMWEKIVLNLISNAFKFTFEGKIVVSLAQAGDHVELRARDTGVGVAAEELPKLFDRFHRIENSRSRTHEGSGIGLALVQELVKLHGGSVRAESAPGEGTTFIVSVPLGKAHLPVDRIGGTRTLATTAVGAAPFVEEALRWLPDAEQSDESAHAPTVELMPVPYTAAPESESEKAKRPFILIADDNADMRQYLFRLLTERYEIKSVPDGQAALEAVRERSPDLVLSDVMMPRLDGFGLVHALRNDARTRTIPIILLSARAGEESRVEGMEHGADDYLIKPFSSRELLARVQTHLQMARIRKQAEEALRANRERFDLVTEASQVGFWFCDLPFDKLAWDARVKEHFWLPPDAEVTIDTFYERIHPDDRERTRQAIAYSNANDTPYNIEYRTVSPDGRQKWIRAIGRTFYDDARNPIRFDGVTLDITERVVAEERERQTTADAIAANAKFRSLFEQTPVFAGVMTLDGTVIEANRLSLDACGYRAEEVLGRPFWETGWWRLCPESKEKIRVATITAAQGVPYQEILTYHWADGTERIVDFGLHPIRDHENKILFLHPTGIDITDLKRAEEGYRNLAETLDAEVRIRTIELEQRNVEVLKQSELLRHFSQRLMEVQDEERRHIARELHDSAGQTLTALGINLAGVAGKIAESLPELAEEVTESQRLAQQLSQEIRTMAYLLHPPMLDENGLAGALRWYTQGATERSGVEIALDIAPDFGRLPRDMELMVFRIVQECLTNIHRHSGSKTALIRIAREDDAVSVVVRDEGRGMSPDKLAEIQKSQGSGVGINGMRERVRQFRGTMNIESMSPGTQVSIRLPVTSAPSRPKIENQELELTG